MKKAIRIAGAALAAAVLLSAPALAQYAGGRHGGGRGEVHGEGNDLGAEITVYSGPGFTGRRLTFTSSQRDLGGYDFNDQALSVRARGPWRICTDSRYDGRCEWVNGDIADLRRMGMGYQLSSLELVSQDNGHWGGGGYDNGGGYNNGGGGYNNGGGGWNRGGRLILYTGRYFHGESFEVRGDGVSNLSGAFNDRAQSARVIGVWTVCSDANFGGRCVALRGDNPNLDSFGMGRTISSAHPGY